MTDLNVIVHVFHANKFSIYFTLCSFKTFAYTTLDNAWSVFSIQFSIGFSARLWTLHLMACTNINTSHFTLSSIKNWLIEIDWLTCTVLLFCIVHTEPNTIMWIPNRNLKTRLWTSQNGKLDFNETWNNDYTVGMTTQANLCGTWAVWVITWLVTCRFISISFSLYSSDHAEPASVDQFLMMYMLYDVFPCKEVPFGGRVNKAPNVGVKFPQKKHFGVQ